MIAVVPDRKILQPDYDPSTAGKLAVPITLVRSDGVIFPHSQEEYVYTPEPVAVSQMQNPDQQQQQPPAKRQRLDMVKTEEQPPAAASSVYSTEPTYHQQPSSSTQIPFPTTHFSTTPTVRTLERQSYLTLTSAIRHGRRSRFVIWPGEWDQSVSICRP